MLDPPELIAHSLSLFSLPRVLSFPARSLLLQQTPSAEAVATSHTQHIDTLNLTVEAVHHNSCAPVCWRLSLLARCLNLYSSITLQCATPTRKWSSSLVCVFKSLQEGQIKKTCLRNVSSSKYVKKKG